MNTTEALKVLGLAPSASATEIKQAYRELMQQYHPDKVAHLGPEFRVIAEQKAKEINEAYQVLKGYIEKNPAPTPQQLAALKIFGLTPSASPADINQAYSGLIKQYDPDKFSDLGHEFRELGARKKREIDEAYQTLKGYGQQSPPPPPPKEPPPKQPPKTEQSAPPPPPPPRAEQSAPPPPKQPPPPRPAAPTQSTHSSSDNPVLLVGLLAFLGFVSLLFYSYSNRQQAAPIAAPPPPVSDVYLIQRAEQGNVQAQLSLGGRNYGAESVRWYRKAADQGSAQAQEKLGCLFLWGLGAKCQHSGVTRGKHV